MTVDQDILERAIAQRNCIIEELRSAGINGCTNIYLYDYVTKSLGARLSELYERGYYIQCTKLQNGIYNYVLIAEPIKPFAKPMRAEDLLLKRIEEDYQGKISINELKSLLESNDLIISRKAGALKRQNVEVYKYKVGRE